MIIHVVLNYPIFISDVNISSFVNKVFHHVLMSSFSSHMQQSPLMERKKLQKQLSQKLIFGLLKLKSIALILSRIHDQYCILYKIVYTIIVVARTLTKSCILQTSEILRDFPFKINLRQSNTDGSQTIMKLLAILIERIKSSLIYLPIIFDVDISSYTVYTQTSKFIPPM